MAVFRHGDRTPKQKMKMKTSDQIFLNYFSKKKGKDLRKEIKLKTPRAMQRMLDKTRKLLKTVFSTNESKLDLDKVDFMQERERIAKLIQLVNILQKDKFEGLNRKVQLKPLKIEKDDKTG